MITITPNNKTYKWIGDWFGVWKIPKNVHLSESMQNTIAFFADEYDKEIYPYGEKLMDTKKDIFDLVSEGYMEEVRENKEPSYDEMVAMGMPTELVGMQWGENTLSKIQDDWKRDNGFLSEEKEKTNPSLEEVEENKEPDLEEGAIPHEDCTWNPDPSILEKLRKFLEKNQKECFDTAKLFKGEWQEHHHNGAGAMCSATLDLLTSLEQPCYHVSDGQSYLTNPPQYKCKKCGKFYRIGTFGDKGQYRFSDHAEPQFTPGQEEKTKYRDMLGNPTTKEKIDEARRISESGIFLLKSISDLPSLLPEFQWQPTPGQEIEVSNDGEKWEKREFVEHANDDEMEYFMCKDYPEDKPYLFWWKFARPIDKIEPELPNVPDYKTMFDHSIANPIDVQVEHLTTFCQALARQKSTK